MANRNTQQSVLVYAHWQGLAEPTRMGTLHSISVKGKEVFSFEYYEAWLKVRHAQYLDPDLQLFAGAQYLKDEKTNFGIFLDSSPDRWGRVLMKRREAILARTEERKEKILFEIDYLLGVFDSHRMGAIRFKETEDGPFLNNNKAMPTPPWTQLRELEHASLELEKDTHDDAENTKWLNVLLAPGSSLGGARPKASVVDPMGNLWIAKFPSSKDDKDMGAWEKVVHELGGMAGINVGEATTGIYYSKQHTFLSKRFDRTADGKRIHFASAMTLLGHTDGANHTEGVSYLELAEFIMQHGGNANEDLEELWRRIVFYICVSNTDDHLRNHGFLLTNRGWILSPAYDINPEETGTGLSLNISETDNSLNLDLALEVADYFRVTKTKGAQIIAEVKDVVSQWDNIAAKFDISKSSRLAMAAAFQPR